MRNDSDAGERLRRLLSLVPYLAQHRGISVDTLARELNLDRQTVMRDLSILPLVGRPPFSPGDYLDLTIEDGRVNLTLDERFSRPPQLTASEAAALVAAASFLDPQPGDPMRVVLDKIEACLPKHVKSELAHINPRLMGSGHIELQGVLATLARSASARNAVVMEYMTPSAAISMRRRVEPWRVFHHGSHWYLLGFDTDKQAKRVFRVDRITRLTSTDIRFVRPRDIPRVGDEMTEVRGPPNPKDIPTLIFSKRLATWALERFPDEAKKVTAGRVRVKLPNASEDWLVSQVLQSAGDVQVVAPATLKTAVSRAVEKTLAAYAEADQSNAGR